MKAHDGTIALVTDEPADEIFTVPFRVLIFSFSASSSVKIAGLEAKMSQTATASSNPHQCQVSVWTAMANRCFYL